MAAMNTTVDPLAGKLPPRDLLIDTDVLQGAYADGTPDPGDPAQRVRFGTSGHRGSALRGSFNDRHVAAIVQAICSYRRSQGIDGPLFLGRDTHALGRLDDAAGDFTTIGDEDFREHRCQFSVPGFASPDI